MQSGFIEGHYPIFEFLSTVEVDISVTERMSFRAHFPLVIFAVFHQAEPRFFIWCLQMDLESICQLDDALESYCLAGIQKNDI